MTPPPAHAYNLISIVGYFWGFDGVYTDYQWHVAVPRSTPHADRAIHECERHIVEKLMDDRFAQYAEIRIEGQLYNAYSLAPRHPAQSNPVYANSVSYTHLTLPTICSV